MVTVTMDILTMMVKEITVTMDILTMMVKEMLVKSRV